MRLPEGEGDGPDGIATPSEADPGPGTAGADDPADGSAHAGAAGEPVHPEGAAPEPAPEPAGAAQEAAPGTGAADPQGPAGLPTGGAGAPGAPDAPAAKPAPKGPSREKRVAAAAERWAEDLRSLGAASTLADMGLLGEAILDLTTAHPGGIASLYAGRATALSNIVRQPDALERARRQARTVQNAATELTHRFGIAPTFLAVGVATWTLPPGRVLPGLAAGDHLRPSVLGDIASPPRVDLADGAVPGAAAGRGAGRSIGTLPSTAGPGVVRAPVLLRPVRLTPHEGPHPDLDLQLDPSVEINPVLVAALREHDGPVDVTALAHASFGGAGFAPRAALEELRAIGAATLPNFELTESIVVGTFLDPGHVLVEDLSALRYRLADSDVLAALAGDAAARETLAASLPERADGDRDPAAERGVGDLDPTDQHAVDVVAAGRHVLLDAPAGSSPERLVAAVLADAAASGRRVLYVPGSKRIGQAALDRLTAAGLEDVVLDLSADPGWQARAAQQLRRSVATREMDLDVATLQVRRDELGDVHGRLARYVEALHSEREPWGVSVHTVLQELARLAAAHPAPRTTVRLEPEVLRALRSAAREDARGRLQRAAGLGAFSVRPEDTPWYGAHLTTEAEAADALTRAGRLAQETLPALRAEVASAADQTGLTPAAHLAAWAEQLHMLDGVADSLDVFAPQVYERPVRDLVIATAPRAWRREHDETMSANERRDLRRTALELVRPGRSAPDVHSELLKVEAQRETWARHTDDAGWPRLPEGLAQMRRTERAVRADLDALAGVLAPRDVPLTEMPLADVQSLASELAADAAALRDVPARAALVAGLRAQGLGALVDDLAARNVPASLVGAELELAWWGSVFHDVVSADAALAGYDGPAIGALAQRFRDLDAGQTASLSGPVRHAVVERLRAAVYADTDVAADLYHSLGTDGGGHLRSTLAAWPDLTWALRPVRLVAPMLVPQVLTAGADVDLLVLDHPRQIPTAQLVGTISRATQVVVVADSRAGLGRAAAELGGVLPSVTLSTRRPETASGVMAMLAAHGYGDVATLVPTPPGPARVRLDHLTGEGTTGTPAPGVEAVESPAAEVEHVIGLVRRHAAEQPQRSLAVVALSERHAAAIRGALRRAAREDDALHRFLTARRHEHAVAIGAEDAAGLRRDVVILSVGYGKTPHGRVLHQFGPVSAEGGRACLVEALAAVREELIVVSCLGPGEIQADRVRTPGPHLLADLIDQAATGSLIPRAEGLVTEVLPIAVPVGTRDADQLLVDLAERLWQAGVTVVPRYRVGASVDLKGTAHEVEIPLAVGHPDLPDEVLVAVLTDDDEYVAEPSLRRRDRHELEVLERHGWVVRRVFSAAVFLDQQQQARAIADLTRRVVAERRAAEADAQERPAGDSEKTASGGGGSDGPAGVGREAGAAGADRPTPAEAPADAAVRGEGDEGAGASGSAADTPVGGAHPGVAATPGRPATDGDAATAAAAGGPEAPGSPEAPGAPAVRDAAGSPADVDGSPVVRRFERPRPLPRGKRPNVEAGLGLPNYTDEQLDAMTTWICSDSLPRTDAQLVTELRAHLAIRDTGNAARAVLTRVARRRRP